MNRRDFLKMGATGLALASLPGWANIANPERRLVIFFLEGGLDGLSTIVPKLEGRLESFREELMPDNLLDLSSHWALHPAMRATHQLMLQQDVLGIHATSFPYTKRSHFEGQNLIQGGGLAPFSESTGWVGRALDIASNGGRAMSLDTPLLLRGTTGVDNYYPAHVNGSSNPTTRLLEMLHGSLSPEWQTENDKLMARLNGRVFNSRDRSPRGLSEEAGKALARPDGPVAAMIRLGGYDTHAGQGGKNPGRLFSLTGELDTCISTLRKNLGDAWDNTTFITLTEFGRTVKVNGSSGTEHGYGTAMLVGGGAVNGGAVLADWPGLAKSDQFERRDLMATIDSRSICAAVLEHTFGLEHAEIAERVFFTPNLPRLTDRIYL